MDTFSSIEAQLKTLWEKAQQAGAVITRLREEKHVLQARVEELEREVAKLRAEIALKERQIQTMTVTELKATSVVSNGEKEQLTAKVKELLARIDAYL